MLDGDSFCEQCGGRIEPDDDICQSCGARTSVDEGQKKKVEQEKLKEFLADDHETPMLEEAENKNPSFNKLLVVVAIVLIAVMVGGIYYQKIQKGAMPVPMKREDLTAVIVGTWKPEATKGKMTGYIVFNDANCFVVKDRNGRKMSEGAYRFPRMNEIEMITPGSSSTVMKVTRSGDVLVFFNPVDRSMQRYVRMEQEAEPEATPGAGKSSNNDICGDWRIVRIEAPGSTEAFRAHWQRVIVRIAPEGSDKLVWQNLDQQTGSPQKSPDGSEKLKSYLELEKNSGPQRDGMIVNVFDGGAKKGQASYKIPIRIIMETGGKSLTMQLIWPGEKLVTLYAITQ